MTDTKEQQEQEAAEMNRDPITGAPGAHPIGTGVGAVSGAIAGGVVGAIGGPVSAAVFGALGAVAGGLAGKDAGEAVNPTGEERYWRDAYRTEPYFKSIYTYDDYAPAYRAGYTHRLNHPESFWIQAEIDLKSGWELSKDKSRLLWEEASHAARAAWHRIRPTPGSRKDGTYY